MSANARINVEVNTERAEENIRTFQGAIDLVGGAVEATVGGLALLGVENEYIENLEQGTLGAIAFADGLKRFADGAVALAPGLGRLAIGTRIWNAALNANPIGLIITGVLAATAAITALIVVLGNQETAQEKLNESLEAGRERYASQILDLELYQASMERAGTATKATTLAIKEQKDALNRQGEIEQLTEDIKKLTEAQEEAANPGFWSFNNFLELNAGAGVAAAARATEIAKISDEIAVYKEKLGQLQEKDRELNSIVDNRFTSQENEIELMKARGDAAEEIYLKEFQLLSDRIKFETDADKKAEFIHKQELLRIGESNRKKQESNDKDVERRENNKASAEELKQQTQERYDMELSALQSVADKEIQLAAARGETDEQINIRIDNQLQAQLELAEGIENKELREKAIAEAQDAIDEQNHQREVQRIQTETNKRIEDEAKIAQAKIDNKTAADAILNEFELEEETPNEKFQREQDEKLAILRTALENESITQAEFASASDKIAEDSAEFQAKLDQDANIRKVQLAGDAISAIGDIASLFAGESEAEQRKAFQINKAFNLATAITNTGLAVTAALTAGGNPVKLATGAQFVEAGIAAATGAVNVAKIAQTKFESSTPPSTGGGGGGRGPIPSLSIPGGGFDVPENIDRQSAIFAENGQSPIQAYVVAGDVQDGLEAEQQLSSRRTL